MKKSSFFVFSLAVALVLSGCAGKEKAPSGKAGPKVSVKLYPSGKLDYLPESLVFSFSREFPSASGLVLSYKEMAQYVKIEPQVPASGRWTSPSTFKLKFLSPLKPSAKYRIKILGVPLKGERLKTVPEVFSLETPGLKVLSFSPLSSSRSAAVLRLAFNGRVKINGLLKHLLLKDEGGRELEILDIKASGNEVYLKVRVSPPATVHLHLSKGLPSSLGPLPRDFSASVSVAIPRNFMMVDKVSFQEGEGSFSVKIKLASPGGEVDLTGMDPLPFLSTQPPVKLKAFASGNSIFLSSEEFLPHRKFTLRVKAGLMDRHRFLLRKDYLTEITFPSRRAKMKFVYQGKYLGREHGIRLPLRAQGLKDLYITVFYIPPVNALFWHSIYEGEDWGVEDFGEKVVDEFHIKPVNGINWLELSEIVGDLKSGVYFLKARGKSLDGKWLKDAMEVVVSDISLVVKTSRKKVYIWAMGAADLKPLSGVRIQVRDNRNFLIGGCSTGGDGFCAVDNPQGRKPFFVFATYGRDWTYLQIPRSSISLTNFDVSGKTVRGDFTAYLYLERDLYRPGERVNFAVLLRKNRDYSGVSVPISVRIIDPKGKEAFRLSAKTDETGLAALSFLTVKTSPTGVYRLRVKVGDKEVAAGSFHLEEFVPERIRVEVKPGETLGDPVRISALYLFGAPASGQRFSAEVLMGEAKFTCPSYPDYRFGPSPKIQAYPKSRETREGTLDNRGEGSFHLSPPSPLPSLPLKVDLTVSVSEGGSGRVSRARASRVYHLRPYYIGLSSKVRRVVEGYPIDVHGVILDPQCRPFEGELQLSYTVYRLSYAFSYTYYEDEYGWSSRILREPVFTGRLKAKGGKFFLEFTPSDSYYDYLVEVVDESSGELTQLLIPGWGWYFTGNAPPSPQALNIRLSRKEGDEGEEVEAQVKLPFEGKILWTLELDGVYKYEVREAKGQVAKWKFNLPEGVPDVYVSALLVRSCGNYLVSRAFGVKRILIRPSRLKMNLELELPRRIKPGSLLKVKVKGKGRFKATVAVVDEGILQITRFASPDPLQGILSPWALGIRTSETFGWRIRKFLMEGGGEGEMKVEGGGIKPGFVKIVSFWSGVLSSEGGQVVYAVKIPQFNGRVRVMAVAVSKRTMGYARGWVEVRDDVVVQPTLPRFLAWGDSFQFPITLANTTEKEKKVSLAVEGSGLRIAGFPENLSLRPKSTEVVWVRASAERGFSEASLRIRVSWDGGAFEDERSIPLKPNLPMIEQDLFRSLSLPAEVNLLPLFDGWLLQGHTAKILISPYPGLSALSHLDYLLTYPYGCIEQTSTSTLAVLGAREFLPVLAPDLTANEVSNMVNHGILRILSMQTYSGGFSFWPGGEETEEWASAYAAFVLQEAKEAGFYVPEASLKGAYYYLKKKGKRGLSYFVLARAGLVQGDPELRSSLISAAESFKDRLDLLWISAALSEAGMKEEAKRLLRRAVNLPPPRSRYLFGDFRSRLKAMAITLLVKEWIEPEAPGLEEELVGLMKELSARSYFYTTQEMAWALLAASQYAELHPPSRDFSSVLIMDGKRLQPRKGKFLQSFLLDKGPSRRQLLLKVQGQGSVFWVLKMRGFKKDIGAFQAEARHLTLTRRFLTLDGVPVRKAKAGDLLLMEVVVSGEGYYDNAAVELPLPAGLEVENPRLNQGDLPVQNTFQPDYIDIRDDKVVLFGEISSRPRKYYIMVRAVTPGEFFLPPATAVLMYGPGYYARTYSDGFAVEKR